MINFENRIAQHPGRYRLTPVPGEPGLYDLERADVPIEEGTRLDKAFFQAFDQDLSARIPAAPLQAYTGTYVGNGQPDRFLPLPATPWAVVVYKPNFVVENMASDFGYGSTHVNIMENGFAVHTHVTNQTGLAFGYIAYI